MWQNSVAFFSVFIPRIWPVTSVFQILYLVSSFDVIYVGWENRISIWLLFRCEMLKINCSKLFAWFIDSYMNLHFQNWNGCYIIAWLVKLFSNTCSTRLKIKSGGSLMTTRNSLLCVEIYFVDFLICQLKVLKYSAWVLNYEFPLTSWRVNGWDTVYHRPNNKSAEWFIDEQAIIFSMLLRLYQLQNNSRCVRNS